LADFEASDVLRHSVLDRLSRTDSGYGNDIRIGFRDLLHAVCRDIEWLLNSKRVLAADLTEFPEARRSILNYGLPDFSHFSGSSPADCQRICRLVTATLQRFEPRLAPATIRVEHVADKERTGTQSRFRIYGLLHVDPVKEPVVFDTEIEMESGSVQITMDE
jgi:type VI secretion system protein ImpF